jgi:hypothetical protein
VLTTAAERWPARSRDRVVLLGGFSMPAASQGADGSPEDWTVDRALMHLEQALEIIDRWGDCPAIGARLQQVVEEVEERGRKG